MRVAVIGTRGLPHRQGGVEKHCESLYPALVESGGVEVTVYCRRPFFRPATGPDSWRGVRLVHLPTFHRAGAEAFWHSFLATLAARRSSADVVHYHNIGPAFFLPLLWGAGKRVILTYHSRNYEHARWGRAARFLMRSGERFSVWWADAIISVSPIHPRHIEAVYGSGAAHKVEVIPNGVEAYLPTAEVQEEILSRHGLERGRYIFAAGRLVEEKGVLDLVRAFGGLDDPELRLVLAGDADYETDYIHTLRREASEDGRVVLLGFVGQDELWSLHRHAGLFVLPSHQEGMPIALLEALTCDVPILVSDIEANRAVPVPEECFYPAGDVKALAGGLRARLGVSFAPYARQRVDAALERDYTWTAVAQRTAAIYRQLTSG